MSKTYTHTMMRKIKTAMVERRRILHGVDPKTGKCSIGFGIIEMQDHILMQLYHQWNMGPKRSGYQRKSEAKSKVQNRRIDKAKLKEEFRKEVDVEIK